MLRNAYFKSIRDLRRPIVWWSLGLFLYAFVIVLFYPSFQDIPDLNEILGDEDSIVRAFIGNVEDLASPEGFLTAEMLSFMFPLLFIVFTLWLGTSLLVGEERRGSLEVLLSHPVRRTTMLLQKFAAIVTGTAALAVVVFVGTLVGIVIVDMDISLLNVIQAYISLALLGVAFGALALFVGAWTGKPSTTVGVGGAVGIVGYVANTFGPIVDGLEWSQYLSPMYYFIGGDPMANGLNIAHAIVLVGASTVLVGRQPTSSRGETLRCEGCWSFDLPPVRLPLLKPPPPSCPREWRLFHSGESRNPECHDLAMSRVVLHRHLNARLRMRGPIISPNLHTTVGATLVVAGPVLPAHPPLVLANGDL